MAARTVRSRRRCSPRPTRPPDGQRRRGQRCAPRFRLLPTLVEVPSVCTAALDGLWLRWTTGSAHRRQTKRWPPARSWIATLTDGARTAARQMAQYALERLEEIRERADAHRASRPTSVFCTIRVAGCSIIGLQRRRRPGWTTTTTISWPPRRASPVSSRSPRVTCPKNTGCTSVGRSAVSTGAARCCRGAARCSST